MEGLAKDDPRRSEYPLTTSDGDGSYVLRRKAWESTGAFVARWQWVEKMRGEGLGTDTQEEAEEVDRMSAMWHNMVSSPLAAAPSPSTGTLALQCPRRWLSQTLLKCPPLGRCTWAAATMRSWRSD